MGQDQRNAIRKALNEDADKLLAEGDPNDPQLRRLRREMEEVNRLFDEFERRAREEGMNYKPQPFTMFVVNPNLVLFRGEQKRRSAFRQPMQRFASCVR